MTTMVQPIRIELSLGIMFHSVNAYLVPGDPLTLVDCGWDSEENWVQLRQAITENGYDVSDIKQIIITHEHRDHIGLLPELMTHTDAIVYAPASTKDWFFRPDEKRGAYLKLIAKVFASLGLPDEVFQGGMDFFEAVRTYPIVPDMDRFRFFKEGEVLHFANTDWTALNTPGHCPTQFVFLQQAQKRLFSGDMLLPKAPMPIITEDPHQPGQPNRPLRELLASFERLRTFDIETIYPGHGPVFTDANATIDRQITRIDMRKAECLEAVRLGCRTPYEINRKMYPHQLMPPNFSGLYMVLGYMDLLEEEGKITIQKDEWGMLQVTCT